MLLIILSALMNEIIFSKNIPFAFEVAFGCQGVRPMSIDRLLDWKKFRRPF
ncbi:hypothetical protein RINTU1_29150 [Candidatus Regiella insecticola]|uniref:Uncharacterized protein n=1 Tax=Candidatus Regiella insecticola TaxID=138073 RepID=A0A6L2ZRH3_9ENTR|nr:hypothetical protein RINTU1_29150 [Candidatus Regiella insecticola]